MMEINEYMVTCLQCLEDNNCDDIFENDYQGDDCDSDLFCADVLTCVDGYLYPTSCGPENCDEPIDTCDEGGDADSCSDLSQIECENSSGCQWEYVDNVSGFGECITIDDQEDCDSDLFCAEVLTCVDGYLYPTSCGPENCDEPIDTCDESGDGDDGPPECILDCQGIEELGSDPGSIEICGFLVSAISTDCVEDCDEETLYELEFAAGACEDCLPTGDCDDLFSDDDCSNLSEDECEESSECQWQYSDNVSGIGECIDANNDDEGLPVCMLDCPGVWDLGPDSEPYEICEFFIGANSSSCIDDCDEQFLYELEFISAVCNDCLASDNCDDVFGDDDTVTGDVNSDGAVNVLDVIQTVNIVLGIEAYSNLADINLDGSVDITDVVSIINIILGNDIAREASLSEASYEIGDDYIRILADADIAGIQISALGSYAIDHLSNMDGWIIKEYRDIIVIANIDGINRSDDVLIKFTGQLVPESIDVAGWNEIRVTATKFIELPEQISLSDAFPNPFNPSTEISVLLDDKADISLKVLNISGQVVSIIASGQYDTGKYSFDWDASDFSSGIYLIQLTSGSFVETKKVTLLK